jgi:predicted DNA-binding protein (UPF0251 family)
MVRPRRCRRVGFGPNFDIFGTRCPYRRGSRRGARGNCEVILTVDEFESIRLKDHLGLEQKEAAEKMGISQPTFSRILNEARKKIAKALVECGEIRVRGGSYTLIK